MPSDLQLIDGFEALRVSFLAANPSVALDPAAQSPSPHAVTLDLAMEAWWRARLDLAGGTSQERRWLRELGKIVRAADAPALSDAPLAALLRKHPTALKQAREAFDALRKLAGSKSGVEPPGNPANLAAEAAAWSAALPGLTGLRAWSFMVHLGRAALAPEAPVRRFLWRWGIIETDKAAPPAGLAPAASALERIAQATGFSLPALARLVEWHVAPDPTLEAAGRCARTPACPGCPFESSCSYVRYQGRGPAASDSSAAAAEAELAILRRRFDASERGSLETAELLALVIGAGGPAPPLETADRLLRILGGVRGVEQASLKEVMAAGALGESKARMIKAALDLGRKVSGEPLQRGDSIEGSADVWEAFRDRFQHIPQEHFIVLLLDAKNRVIETCFVSKGTLTGSLAHPREVFKQAVRHSASAAILMHNHPSGDATPSREDVALTRRLAESGEILGIRVLDHIILGHSGYYSFKDEGRM